MYESSGSNSMGLLFPLAMIVGYLYFSYALYMIAKKLNHDNPWFAWIPILNTIQLIQMAYKPMYWFLLMFVPVVNLVCIAILWIEVAKRCGHSPLVGFLTLIPPFSLVTIGMMAWSGNPSYSQVSPPSQQTPKKPEPVG
ncbi:MAG: hypothetical protein JSU65_06575 [Candidatus Zixiibacteriota bacterium]|nr:MAG: hypothetical protein JSU65_06575 [candidate division Zixibacteria bacterium]